MCPCLSVPPVLLHILNRVPRLGPQLVSGVAHPEPKMIIFMSKCYILMDTNKIGINYDNHATKYTFIKFPDIFTSEILVFHRLFELSLLLPCPWEPCL